MVVSCCRPLRRALLRVRFCGCARARHMFRIGPRNTTNNERSSLNILSSRSRTRAEFKLYTNAFEPRPPTLSPASSAFFSGFFFFFFFFPPPAPAPSPPSAPAVSAPAPSAPAAAAAPSAPAAEAAAGPSAAAADSFSGATAGTGRQAGTERSGPQKSGLYAYQMIRAHYICMPPARSQGASGIARFRHEGESFVKYVHRDQWRFVNHTRQRSMSTKYNKKTLVLRVYPVRTHILPSTCPRVTLGSVACQPYCWLHVWGR